MSEPLALAPIFHERSRLSMMTVLAANPHGVAFTELRDLCKLTDGNLSRHLHKLAEAGLIVMEKKFVNGTPNTTIRVTAEGIEQFSRYLEELEQIVAEANRAMSSRRSNQRPGRTTTEEPVRELRG